MKHHNEMLYALNGMIGGTMQRLVKWLLYLAVIALVLLIGYAYIGPYFGADFAPNKEEIRVPVTLTDD
ncbi:hypothetical protein N9X05_01915 [Paracoccaceae bacterium]|nr:hypothetical protein [Paracoccaceae bacterium]